MPGGVAQSWCMQGFLAAARATSAKQVTAQFGEREKKSNPQQVWAWSFELSTGQAQGKVCPLL